MSAAFGYAASFLGAVTFIMSTEFFFFSLPECLKAGVNCHTLIKSIFEQCISYEHMLGLGNKFSPPLSIFLIFQPFSPLTTYLITHYSSKTLVTLQVHWFSGLWERHNNLLCHHYPVKMDLFRREHDTCRTVSIPEYHVTEISGSPKGHQYETNGQWTSLSFTSLPALLHPL